MDFDIKDFKPSGNIIVFGSIIMDICIKCEEFPKTGETVYTKENYTSNSGGKGGNQAVSIARLGGEVKLIGALAKDEYGRILKENLKNEGVDIKKLILKRGSKSGVAFVWVDNHGDNKIICSPSVNMEITSEEIVDSLDIIKKGDIFMTTLEYPLEISKAVLKKAKEKGALTILDPSSSDRLELSKELGKHIDIIKPNEVEVTYLVGNSSVDFKSAIKYLKNKGVLFPIISLGEKGVIYELNNEIINEPAIEVNAIDPTAAGDTFLGGLATSLSRGKSIEESIKFAIKAASICVQRFGAIESIPFKEDII